MIIVAENLGVQTCCNVFRVFHVGSDLFFFLSMSYAVVLHIKKGLYYGVITFLLL